MPKIKIDVRCEGILLLIDSMLQAKTYFIRSCL